MYLKTFKWKTKNDNGDYLREKKRKKFLRQMFCMMIKSKFYLKTTTTKHKKKEDNSEHNSVWTIYSPCAYECQFYIIDLMQVKCKTNTQVFIFREF